MTKKHLIAGILSLSLVTMIALPLVVNGQVDEIAPKMEDVMLDTGLNRSDLVEVVNAIIKIALSFLGIIAVVIILIAGFEWMTAGGNADKIAGAKQKMLAGVGGLVVIFLAYAIANFIIEQLIEVTG